jgi:hypothetical protein
MALTEQGGVFGDWGPDVWADADATVQPNGMQVVANDVLTQSTTAQGQDKWTGFFQNLVGSAAKYAIQRDAAKNGLVQQRSANGQPVYVNDQAALRVGSVSVGGWIVIGAAVIGVLLVASHKG